MGATRAGEVAEELAEAKLPVALEPVLLNDRALEYGGHSESTAAILADAGIPVAITSAAKSPTGSRYLRLQACAAVRGGLDREKALGAITIEAARALGLDGRIGSIDSGKDADLVLFDGDPLDSRSRVVQVIVDGVVGKRRELVEHVRWPRLAPGAESASASPGKSAFALGKRVPVRILRGARVVRVQRQRGEVLVEDGLTIVVEDGKIARVTKDEVGDRDGAVVHDLGGKWLLPGFVDAHSHLGLQGETDDVSFAVNEELRILDGFDPWNREIELHLRRGVTSVALSPGRMNVVGGEISVLKLVPRSVPVRVVRGAGSVKTSLAPNFGLPRYPVATSGAFDVLESWLRRRKTSSGDAPGSILVYFESLSQAERLLLGDAAADCRLIFLEGVGTDSRTFGEIPTSEPVILGPYSTVEPERVLRAPGVLEEKGRAFAFSTAGSRDDLLTTAVLSIHHGLGDDAALLALTSTPALIHRAAGRVGNIEEGADADLVVWSDNPFTMTGRVEQVFIDGELLVDGDRTFEGRVGTLATGPSAAAGVIGDRAVAHAPVREHATVLGGATASMPAEERSYLLRARRVYPVSRAPIDGGEELVRAGKIVAVGEPGSLDADGATVVDVDGSLVPGLVDAGSGVGISGRRVDEFRELTPALHSGDGIDLDATARRLALFGGVTTAAVTPGNRNVVGGFGAVMKTSGRSLRHALVEREPFVALSLSALAAASNRSLRSGVPNTFYYRIPTTRMGTVYLARRALLEAKHGGWPQSLAEGDVLESGLSEMLRPVERAVLRDVLAGKRRLRVRADTHAEIHTALRLAAEFEIRVQIEGGRESLRTIGVLKDAGVSVILDADDVWSRHELDANPHVGARIPAELARAGVPFAIQSGSATTLHFLRERVAWMLRSGLPADAALEAITLTPARLLGIDQRVGSLSAGRDADLLAIGGEPFSITAPLLWVMVDGLIVPIDGPAPVDRKPDRQEPRVKTF